MFLSLFYFPDKIQVYISMCNFFYSICKKNMMYLGTELIFDKFNFSCSAINSLVI